MIFLSDIQTPVPTVGERGGGGEGGGGELRAVAVLHTSVQALRGPVQMKTMHIKAYQASHFKHILMQIFHVCVKKHKSGGGLLGTP